MTQITEPGMYPDIKEEPVMTEEQKHEVATVQERQMAAAEPLSPLSIIASAVERGMDASQLNSLMDFQDRMDAKAARKTFMGDMIKFKADVPELIKNKKVKFSSTEYDHITLDRVVYTVVPVLARHGFSHRWTTRYLDEGQMEVTCHLDHQDGHSEQTSMRGKPDKSGSKNEIQQGSSAQSYLERYTLLSILGLAAKGMDDDGRGASDKMPDENLSMLKGKIDELREVGTFDEGAFLKSFAVTDITDLNADQWQRAMGMIAKKIAKATTDKGEGKAA
jgi:hypothetical protein